MPGRAARLLLVAALAFAAVGATARAAKADIFLRVDCTKVAADAFLTLGANTPFVWAVSSGGTYAASGCYGFVTDVYVPTSSSGGDGYLGWFHVRGGSATAVSALSQAECDDYSGNVAVYKRTFLGTDFGFLGGGSVHGVWTSPGYCRAVEDAGFVDVPLFTPSVWFATTYRVVVGAKVGSTWRQVYAGARYEPVPS